MNELLPCPFCKAAAVLVEHDHDTAGSYWVACCASHTCPASEVIVDKPTREEAIAAWNTRAPIP